MSLKHFKRGDRVACFGKHGHPLFGTFLELYGDLALMSPVSRRFYSVGDHPPVYACRVKFPGKATSDLVNIADVELAVTQEIVNAHKKVQER